MPVASLSFPINLKDIFKTRPFYFLNLFLGGVLGAFWRVFGGIWRCLGGIVVFWEVFRGVKIRENVRKKGIDKIK